MIFTDFLLDDDGDLLIQNGDLVTGPSDQQHIADIIVAFPGEYKQFPQVGCGAFAYLNSSGREQEISRLVRLQLIADGYTVTMPEVTIESSGKLSINPNAYRQ